MPQGQPRWCSSRPGGIAGARPSRRCPVRTAGRNDLCRIDCPPAGGRSIDPGLYAARRHTRAENVNIRPEIRLVPPLAAAACAEPGAAASPRRAPARGRRPGRRRRKKTGRRRTRLAMSRIGVMPFRVYRAGGQRSAERALSYVILFLPAGRRPGFRLYACKQDQSALIRLGRRC